jgi:hypothetical protein
MGLFRTLAIAAAVGLASSAHAAVFTFTGEVSGPVVIFGANGSAFASAFPLPNPFDWSATFEVAERPFSEFFREYEITNLDLSIGPYTFSGPVTHDLGFGNGYARTFGGRNADFNATIVGVTSPYYAAGPISVGISLGFDTDGPNPYIPSLDASSYKFVNGGLGIADATGGIRFGEASFIGPDVFTLTGASITGSLTSVPEPGEWLLLGAGFGIVGLGLRTGRRLKRLA